ncbi:MAG: FHA domain-containing protein, partial [Chloroflexaceae bacterium]|nr:FHA domain-containing protein [Chloroflexaceae bacterium]
METSFWAVVETFTNSRWWFGTPVVVVATLALLVAILATLRLPQSSRVGAGVAVLGLSGALALFSPALLLAVAPFTTLGIDSGELHTLPTASFAATARHLDQALQLSYVGGAMLVLGALGAFGAFGNRKPGSPCPTCGRERHAGWNGVCPECQMMQPRLAESPMMLLGDRSASGQMVTQFAPAQTALLESSEASNAWLEIVEAEHGSGERFAISARLTIGRDPNHCQVVLDDEAISSRHAYI